MTPSAKQSLVDMAPKYILEQVRILFISEVGHMPP